MLRVLHAQRDEHNDLIMLTSPTSPLDPFHYLQLKRKSEALWKFVDGPRPRIPWLPIEDYLISVMLLKKKVYHNGAFYVCTRYTPGKFVQVKEFFTDFEPVWMRNNRDMSHVNDRLSVLRSGGGATTMSGVIAKRFMAEAARDFKVDLVRKIMGRIMALDMNEDVDPIRKKFTDLVKDYTELVSTGPVQSLI